jgi:hypothetical protein
VRRAQLEQPEEFRLLEQLQNNSNVCTSELGRTRLLKNKIFHTQERHIKQKPYRLSPAKMMPFGLKNEPATFQRLMCWVREDMFSLSGRYNNFSQMRVPHFQNLQVVLDKLRVAGLTVNMKKSIFFQTSLTFIGHIVSYYGIT